MAPSQSLGSQCRRLVAGRVPACALAVLLVLIFLGGCGGSGDDPDKGRSNPGSARLTPGPT